jgi:hypothetical protein
MTTNQSLNVNDRTLKCSGPNTDMTNVVDARANFKARALIATVEGKLTNKDLEKYDVYCEWYEDDVDNIEIWLRDRTDDSRIGPLDLNMFQQLN